MRDQAPFPDDCVMYKYSCTNMVFLICINIRPCVIMWYRPLWNSRSRTLWSCHELYAWYIIICILFMVSTVMGQKNTYNVQLPSNWILQALQKIFCKSETNKTQIKNETFLEILEYNVSCPRSTWRTETNPTNMSATRSNTQYWLEKDQTSGTFWICVLSFEGSLV